MTKSLRSSETHNVALTHSLLNELVKGYSVPMTNRQLQSRLDALRHLANPSTGLAQTAIWHSIDRLADFDEINASVMGTLARHIQGKFLLGLQCQERCCVPKASCVNP